MPSIAEKVKALRKHKNISQQELATYITTTNDMIAAVEAGKAEYSDRHIDEIKKLFDIVDMPLDDNDREAFMRRLYVWRAYMKRDIRGEAVTMHKELAKAVNLEPCDHNLAMLYKIFEARMLAEEKRLPEAEEKFNLISPINLDKETLFQYYYVKGYISMHSMQYETCLAELLIAHELIENNPGLLPEYDTNGKTFYFGIAWCYTYIEIPYRAISFLYKARELSNNDIIDNLAMRIDIMLAQNYILVNELDKAEKLLRKRLLEAQSVKDDYYVGMIKHLFGLLYKASKNYSAAIAELDTALKYVRDGSWYYPVVQYDYIHSYICDRQFSRAQQLLKPVLAKYSLDEFWTKQFESLRHYCIISSRLSLKNKESCEYIEKKAIPNFEESCDYFRLIDYCELLESHYKATKSYRNALLIGVKMRDIYKRCFFNPERMT